MDKSRPGPIALKSPLIERPDLQSPRQRTLYGLLTLAFWAFWFYLWLPLLALLAWSLGFQQAFKYMVKLEGYREVIRLMGVYGLIILLLGGALIVWAVYNIIRFREDDRRTGGLTVTPTAIGREFGQDPVAVARWQTERRLCVTHNQDGRIVHVETLPDELVPAVRVATAQGEA